MQRLSVYHVNDKGILCLTELPDSPNLRSYHHNGLPYALNKRCERGYEIVGMNPFGAFITGRYFIYDFKLT